MSVFKISLDDRQRLSWLRLIRASNVGPASFRDLINRFGSAETALEALPQLTIAGGAKNTPHIPTIEEAEEEMDRVRRIGAEFVALGEENYPPSLSLIENPPPLLTIRGSSGIFSSPNLAIVGARNASLAGLKFARTIASDLGREGYVVVSGLARGIDTAAHQGALETGTVAVFAGGLEKPYPAENINLIEKIIEHGGAIVSEMPIDREPRSQDFPRRNRIISGISLGMLVVEANRRSGSLISARFALEMGRDVFAVPGSPLDPRSFGTNSLLKNGAILTTEALDIIQQLSPMKPSKQDFSAEEFFEFNSISLPEQKDRNMILEALGSAPVSIDELIRHTNLHPAIVFMILLELDLAGKIERHDGASVSLTFSDKDRF